jgi:hypothetical protein
MTQLLPTLTAVRELLSSRERWTQGCMARNQSSLPVEPLDPSAVCWCLVGAMYKVNSNLPLLDRYKVVDALYKKTDRGLMSINDAWSHPEVLSFLDEQIAKETPSA